MPGPCRCCGLSDVHFPKPKVPDGLPVRQDICGVCSRHQGSLEVDLRRRIKQHLELWEIHVEKVVDDLTAAHAAEVGRLTARVTELQQELEARPVRVVYENADQEDIDRAKQDRRTALRSRDRAFRDLTQLHLMHFETSSGRCRCGQMAERCEPCKILDGSPALRAWERRQSERRRDQQPHQLPRGHPGVVDDRWDPDHPVLNKLYDEAAIDPDEDYYP